jgi:hypothetical protein
MFGLKIKTTDDTKRVAKAADKAAFKNFRHAAASISKDAKASIDKAPQGEASAPGDPPHTHKGQFIKRAIRFDGDEDGAVIGPMASVVGEVGAVHEFGEVYKGADFEERAFMGPALERAIPRIGGDWQGSIGS